MTPDQLNEIEARAKAAMEQWPTVPDDPFYIIHDIPRLVARVRDLEQSLDQWQGSHENEVNKREKAEDLVKTSGAYCRLRDENDRLRTEYHSGMLANGVKNASLLKRAEKAEARVKELEAKLAVVGGEALHHNGRLITENEALTARVAVLREALQFYADSCSGPTIPHNWRKSPTYEVARKALGDEM